MIVVSTCHISSGANARTLSFGAAGWRRRRGRRQPRLRASLYQVAGAANTVPRRWARIASRPVGTCRYSGDSTISFIAKISAAVSRVGVNRGQLGWSSRPQVCSACRQRW